MVGMDRRLLLLLLLKTRIKQVILVQSLQSLDMIIRSLVMKRIMPIISLVFTLMIAIKEVIQMVSRSLIQANRKGTLSIIAISKEPSIISRTTKGGIKIARIHSVQQAMRGIIRVVTNISRLTNILLPMIGRPIHSIPITKGNMGRTAITSLGTMNSLHQEGTRVHQGDKITRPLQITTVM